MLLFKAKWHRPRKDISDHGKYGYVLSPDTRDIAPSSVYMKGEELNLDMVHDLADLPTNSGTIMYLRKKYGTLLWKGNLKTYQEYYELTMMPIRMKDEYETDDINIREVI